jgi:diketogulonate reductase-like aldo/keto reductase
MIQRIIPSSGELLPVIGLGTGKHLMLPVSKIYLIKNVLTTLHKAGGTVIDSSPMYGRAEKVVDDITAGMDVLIFNQF